MSTFFFFLFYIILAALNKWQTHRHNYSPTCSFGYLSKARFTRYNFLTIYHYNCYDLSLTIWIYQNIVPTNIGMLSTCSNLYSNFDLILCIKTSFKSYFKFYSAGKWTGLKAKPASGWLTVCVGEFALVIWLSWEKNLDN